MNIIVYVVATSDGIMRVCWNRQTGTFEGRVSIDVWVQVPSLAPEKSVDFKKSTLFSAKFACDELNVLRTLKGEFNSAYSSHQITDGENV